MSPIVFGDPCGLTKPLQLLQTRPESRSPDDWPPLARCHHDSGEVIDTLCLSPSVLQDMDMMEVCVVSAAVFIYGVNLGAENHSSRRMWYQYGQWLSRNPGSKPRPEVFTALKYHLGSCPEEWTK